MCLKITGITCSITAMGFLAQCLKLYGLKSEKNINSPTSLAETIVAARTGLYLYSLPGLLKLCISYGIRHRAPCEASS